MAAMSEHLRTTITQTVEYLDPPDCKCTDCLIGESKNMTLDEYDEFGGDRITRKTIVSVLYDR